MFAGVGRGRPDELAEERLGPVRAGVELGVELRGDEERVVGQLDHLDQAPVGGGAAGDQALVFEPVPQLDVDLVAVAVAFVDHLLCRRSHAPVCPRSSRTGSAPSRIVPPMSETSFCSGSRSTTGIGRLGIELGGVGAVHPGNRAGELDDRDLHPEADPQIGDLALAGDLGGGDLALDAALAEAAGDQDPVHSLERPGIEVLRVDQLDLGFDAVMDAAVLDRLDHRLVGVGEGDVLADDRDLDLTGGGIGAAHHRLPLGQVRRGRLHR